MTGSQRTAVARQIRNRQRHSPNPTQPSRGKSARIQCSFDQLGRSNRHRGASLKLPSGEFRVRTNASVGRTLAHKRHSAGNLRGGLCGIAMQKLARIRPVNIETKIESIEKRTRYSTPVALKRSVGASRRHHSLTTRTRVHRRHEEEPRGHFDSGFGTSNPYGALFERLSKRIEHHRAELSEFIKEEHAGMQRMTCMFLEARHSSRGETSALILIQTQLLNDFRPQGICESCHILPHADLVPPAFPHVRNGAKKML
jgi:hypothetical protein